MGNTLGMEVGHLLDERQALGRLTLGKCIFMNFPASKRQVERGVGFKFTKKYPTNGRNIFDLSPNRWKNNIWSLEPTRLVLLLFDFCFRPAPYCVSYIASLLGAVLPFPLLWFGRLASDNIYQKWPCLVKVGGLFDYSIKPEKVGERLAVHQRRPQTAYTSIEHGRYSHA